MLLSTMGDANAWGTMPKASTTQYRGTAGNLTQCPWMGGGAGGAATACALEVNGPGSSLTCGAPNGQGVHQCTGNRTYQCGGNTCVTPLSMTVSSQTVVACPANSTEAGSDCRCNAGFKGNGTGGGSTECVPYTCTAGETIEGMFQGSGLRTCQDGCTYQGKTAFGGADGRYWVDGTHTGSGETCEGGGGGAGEPVNVPPSPPNDGSTGPPSPCASGKCPGTVNGASICVPCSTSTTGGQTDPTKPAGDGKTTVTNPDGTKTTTETTTTCASDGTCKTTTVTTTRNPDGTPVGEPTTKEKEESKDSFCKENPESPLCKTSTWGGACGGGFQCEGDAVQCAMSKEVHKRNCEVHETPNQWSIKAEAAATTGLARPAGHPLNDQETTAISFGSGISQTDLLSGGCPQNVSISVQGRAYVIPWAQHCDKFQLIGQLLVGVSMLAAAMIVFRG